MSVVVRMEMPKHCEYCPMCRLYRENGRVWCNAANRILKQEWKNPDWTELDIPKPDWCPIICSLPEWHGRLGDLDALADDVRSLWDYKTVDGITATTVLKQTLTDIRNCPTIVPAERSET